MVCLYILFSHFPFSVWLAGAKFMLSFCLAFSHFASHCMNCWSKAYPSTTHLGAMWGINHRFWRAPYLHLIFQFQQMRSYLHGLLMRFYLVRVRRWLSLHITIMLGFYLSVYIFYTECSKIYHSHPVAMQGFCIWFRCSRRWFSMGRTSNLQREDI